MGFIRSRSEWGGFADYTHPIRRHDTGDSSGMPSVIWPGPLSRTFFSFLTLFLAHASELELSANSFLPPPPVVSSYHLAGVGDSDVDYCVTTRERCASR